MEVRECVCDPDVIRESTKDPDVHLYYRAAPQGYLCVVVAGEDIDERLVVTAYYTNKLKKGQELWIK